MEELFLRYACQDDAIFLFNLANDKESRENSFNTHEISYKEHMAWLEEMLRSEMCRQYIMMDGTLPVGQGRLEMNGNACRISYSIIPERRGYGYGERLIFLLGNAFLRDFPECNYCYGETLKRNVASQKIFEKLGYSAEEKEDIFVYRKYVESYKMISDIDDVNKGGVLLLSNNRNAYYLYDRLKEQGEQVFFYSGKLTEAQVLFLSPSLVVSYNYGYLIPEGIIQLLEGRIVNLHISYLPWNKGSDPNFWSFIDDTPKGVTIHQLSAALDQGDILLQEEVFFNEKEDTFKSAYEALNKEIVDLFIKHFNEIINQKIVPHPQQGTGTYHKRKDLVEFMGGGTVDWNEIIYGFKQRML